MECGQVQELLSAFLDGELSAEEASRLEAHVDQCAACQQFRDALRTQNEGLRRLFIDRRRVAGALAEEVNLQIRQHPTRGFVRRWLPLLLSAAAGFLVAALVFQPWQRAREIDPDHQTVVSPPSDKSELSLIFAKEPIDVQLPGRADWQPIKAGQTFDAGCRVRTKPDHRCAIQTADNSEIRLNGGTEVVFRTSRHLELINGQMMAHVAKAAEAFQVLVAATTVTAIGTEFDIATRPAETTLLVIEGSTSVAGQGPSQLVSSGELAKIVDGRVAEKHPVDPLMLMLTTRWVIEILLMKGRDNPELSQRIDDILAQLGQLKGKFLEEEEIRTLGDRCVLPLTRYLQSPRCEGEDQRGKRLTAARILSDLAQPWTIPDLIILLEQADPEVRFYAAKGLERLTGTTMGHRPDDWRRNSLESMRPTIKSWQDWWRKNQYRCPEGP